MGLEEFKVTGEITAVLMQEAFVKGALFRFKAAGFSMSPFIKNGDIITLSPLSRTPVCLGMVVACFCCLSKRLLVHRIVGKNKDNYLLKGDNVLSSDGFLGKENILGCVVSIEREGKNIYFGLGKERLVIVFLSRTRLLFLFLFLLRLFPKALRKFLNKIF